MANGNMGMGMDGCGDGRMCDMIVKNGGPGLPITM